MTRWCAWARRTDGSWAPKGLRSRRRPLRRAGLRRALGRASRLRDARAHARAIRLDSRPPPAQPVHRRSLHPTAGTGWWWCDALFMAPAAWLRLARRPERRVPRLHGRPLVEDVRLSLRPGRASLLSGRPLFVEARGQWRQSFLEPRQRLGDGRPRARARRSCRRTIQRGRDSSGSSARWPTKSSTLQRPDGFWRASLLDPASYPMQETSGTGFYTTRSPGESTKAPGSIGHGSNRP